MRRWLLALALVAAVAGVLYAATLAETGEQCRACVRVGAVEHCASAAAATREQAERAAIATACAALTSGVTQAIGCEGAPPASMECR